MEKVILAYSGGLDTSCCVRWLKERYGYDVICFSAFIGEVSDKALLRKRAYAAGASKIYIMDLKKEFAKDFVLPALWAHARYEGKYPLATSLGRPLIAKHLVDVAHREKAVCVSHGCTGKGNDQVRIELGVRAMDPSLKIVAPLREWEFKSREEEVDYAQQNRIPISVTKKSVYSIDKNIWGVAIEAGILEDPWQAVPEDAYLFTRGAERKKGSKTIEVSFVRGVPVAIDGRAYPLVALIEKLNAIAGSFGVGRIDMIENRVVGIKSREVYEAPAAEVLLTAHEELEALIFDRDFLHFKKMLSDKYADLVYYGHWFTPLREALDQFFARHQDRVTGTVRFRFSAGQAIVTGRKSPNSVYSETLATYSAKDSFDRTAAQGFMKLWGLPYEGCFKGKKS
ncbi:MAG TPA: argininosuccinate synthase [Candidatus Omnitrophota bacterium]|nr:argininosuccinate synthase [Candidatus Omnitrophota bacterium]